MSDFKPNISPIIYWGLAYGFAGGFLLLLMSLLARYITVVWPFIFLAGLLWGGYRNYRQQKQALGITPAGSPMQEFRQAVSDIANVSQAIFNQNAPEAAPEQLTNPKVNPEPITETPSIPIQDQTETTNEEPAAPVPPQNQPIIPT